MALLLVKLNLLNIMRKLLCIRWPFNLDMVLIACSNQRQDSPFCLITWLDSPLVKKFRYFFFLIHVNELYNILMSKCLYHFPCVVFLCCKSIQLHLLGSKRKTNMKISKNACQKAYLQTIFELNLRLYYNASEINCLIRKVWRRLSCINVPSYF